VKTVDQTETTNKESAHDRNRTGKTAVGPYYIHIKLLRMTSVYMGMTAQDKVDRGQDDRRNQ